MSKRKTPNIIDQIVAFIFVNRWVDILENSPLERKRFELFLKHCEVKTRPEVQQNIPMPKGAEKTLKDISSLLDDINNEQA